MAMTLIMSKDASVCTAPVKPCLDKSGMGSGAGRTNAKALLREASTSCEEAHAEYQD